MTHYELRREVCRLFFKEWRGRRYIARRLKLRLVAVDELLREGMWTPTELRRLRRKEGAK